MYSQLYEIIFAEDEEVGLDTPILSYFFNRSSIEIRFLVLNAAVSELWTLSDILISTMDAISLSRLDLIPKLLMYWLPTHVRNENYIRWCWFIIILVFFINNNIVIIFIVSIHHSYHATFLPTYLPTCVCDLLLLQLMHLLLVLHCIQSCLNEVHLGGQRVHCSIV